jgi:DMSO/TMAO reductase YedYZ molybdopterin-dependent catalytic subunit
MRYPWANIALLILLLTQALTGAFGFVEGRPQRAWILWLHGIGAYAIIFLLLWKSSIILHAWRRKKRWTGRRLSFLVLVALLLLTVALGLLWTFNGPLFLFGFSLVSLHIYLAVPLMILLAWHSWHMRFIWRVRGAAGRRLFLGTAAAAVAGFLTWQVAAAAKRWAGLPGSARRFTGSYETGSFSGRFPRVSWIADRPPPLDVSGWRLKIGGAVDRPLSLTYHELREMAEGDPAAQKFVAVLDCTGGWYTEQEWAGVPVGRLLALAGIKDEARSVTFESVTGYGRRFSLAAAGEYLLALDVAGRPLAHGHGFPARLVAPGRRGVEWVKWIVRIEVNTTSHLLQPPLPLQ